MAVLGMAYACSCCVGGGIVGIGTNGRTRVVLVRSTPEVGACRDLSRAEPPDVSITRLVAGDVRREDREGATNEVRTQDADDRVGEVDTLVRWRGVVGARLGFAAFFGAAIVRVREVVTLLAFISETSVLRVDPDKVRSRAKLPGTDKVVEVDCFDRRETREDGFPTGVGRGGVVLLSFACSFFTTVDFTASAPS